MTDIESPADTMRRAARELDDRADMLEAAGWSAEDSEPRAGRALARWLRFEAVNAPEIGDVVFRGGRSVHTLSVAAALLGEQSIFGEPA